MLTADLPLPGLGRTGLLRQPDNGVPLRGGVVALHGASDPSRRQPLFDHLADTITPLGFAVLSYDRRESASGDVPLRLQADDALAAAGDLAEGVEAPVGVYAFSQGAWAACVAAADPGGPAFLALVGCSGVSPGKQMRYFTDQRLLRAGFDEDARRRQLEARAALEDVFRGKGDRAATSVALSAVAQEPWFDLAYLPAELHRRARPGTTSTSTPPTSSRASRARRCSSTEPTRSACRQGRASTSGALTATVTSQWCR